MLKFDNPPDRVFDNPPKIINPLPILHTFDPATGNYTRAGSLAPIVVIQPLAYRIKNSARNGKCPKEWLDVLFLTKFNRVGLLSLADWYALDLLQCLKLLELRQIRSYGVWLCVNRRVNETTANWGDRKTYIPQVSSYYWASNWDRINAVRTLSDIQNNPWSTTNAK
jgi:hypothetical protein